MAVSLKPDTADELKSMIDDACTEGSERVLGATIAICGLDGRPIFTHASGTMPRNEKLEERRAVRLDDWTRAFSCSKLLATIIALQAIDEGKLDLDSFDFLEKLLPELKEKDQVFSHWSLDANGNKQPEWKPRQNRINVRMLLDHTNQISNGVIDEDDAPMKAWYESTHRIEESEGSYGQYRQMWERYYFHHEPGPFRYTGGIEWAGVLLERVFGESLATLYQRRILEPLGMEDTKVMHWCEPIPDASRLLTHHLRLADGTLIVNPIREGKNYIGEQPTPDFKAFPESDKHAYCVSASLLTTPMDYCKLLVALLNGGVSPTTGSRILTQTSLAAMLTPQLKPEQLENRLATDRTLFSIPLDLGKLDPAGNLGLGCAIQGADRVYSDGGLGRSKGTAYWYGAANSDWWVDFEKGIVVFATTQISPWNDPPWVELMENVEKTIYRGLEPKK